MLRDVVIMGLFFFLKLIIASNVVVFGAGDNSRTLNSGKNLCSNYEKFE